MLAEEIRILVQIGIAFREQTDHLEYNPPGIGGSRIGRDRVGGKHQCEQRDRDRVEAKLVGWLLYHYTDSLRRGEWMQVRRGWVIAALILLAGTAVAQERPGGRGGRAGGFVPGQQRPPGDPDQIARGKTLYSIHCTGCHGADLRGGDMGGPNLLRSQVALSDQDGELIVPIIQGSRQSGGMPAIQISVADAKAAAAYVRSVLETIGRQGMPPAVGMEAPS